MKKRALCLILTLCMVVSLLPMGASAAEIVASGNCGADGDNVTWTLDSAGTLTISGTGFMEDYIFGGSPFHNNAAIKEVVIEEGVRTIGSNLLTYCENIASVSIPSSVEYINSQAFHSCTSLEDLALPDGLRSIGASAFYSCSSLSNMIIPESVTWIGGGVFSWCTSLKEINIPESIDTINYDTFSFCEQLTSVTLPDSVTSIGDRAFKTCSSLKDIEIPNGVTSIGGDAFYQCSSLTDIVIPDGVQKIKDCAFADCSSLNRITLPESATSIGAFAFSGCSSLTSLEIPDNVTSISRQAFRDCSKLVSVKIPDRVSSIEWSTFAGCSSLKRAELPNNLTRIAGEAFSGCSSLESIRIPDGVSAVESGTFLNCTSLVNVEMPANGTEIGENAFSGCSALPEIRLPEGLKTIGDNAFCDCSDLKSISIPAGVEVIGVKAFKDCSGLEEAVLSKGLKTISESAFEHCGNLKAIAIPETVSTIGEGAFWGCTNLSGLKLSKGLQSIEGGAFSECRSLSEVVIPDTVFAIAEEAFVYCSGLETVSIPDSVQTIGETAFAYCSALNSIRLPDTLQQLSDYLFYSCSSLKDVTIPSRVNTIGKSVFALCSSLKTLKIPFGVTSLGDYAFYSCTSLSDITIPVSVTSIGKSAFSGCSKLSDVYYSGSEKKWEMISVGENNEPLLRVKEHFNSLGPEELDPTEPDTPTSSEYEIGKPGVAQKADGMEYRYLSSTSIFSMLSYGLVMGERGFATLDYKAHESGKAEAEARAIQWSVNDPSAIEVTVQQDSIYSYKNGDMASISLTLVPHKFGTYALSATAPDGRKLTVNVNVEPKVEFLCGQTLVTSSAVMTPIARVKSQDACPGFLRAFLEGIFSGEKKISVAGDGKSAMLSVKVQPGNPREVYNFSTPVGQSIWLSVEKPEPILDDGVSWIDEVDWNDPNQKELELAKRAFWDAADGFVKATAEQVESGAEKTRRTSVKDVGTAFELAGVLLSPTVDQKTFDKEWKPYVYQAIAKDVTQLASARMTQVKYSSDPTKLATSLTKAIMSDYSSLNKTVTVENGKYIVDFSLTGIYGAFEGYATIKKASNPSSQCMVVITMTSEQITKVLKQYTADLADLSEQAIDSVYFALAEDMVGMSLTSFATNQIENVLSKYEQKLKNIGLGGFIGFCNNLYKAYESIPKYHASSDDPFATLGDMETYINSLKTYQGDIKNAVAKKAAKKAVKSAENLLQLWRKYEAGESLEPKGLKKVLKTVFSCPINVEVYDPSGNQVGYAGTDDLWFDDSILIEETGDAKVIYTPTGEAYSFRVTGNGYGTWSCAFEQYTQTDALAGRVNYNDIEVTPDMVSEITLPAQAPQENRPESISVRVDGELLFPSKIIRADDDHIVYVQLRADDEQAGHLYGAGMYRPGDAVYLTALENPGYRFDGWYAWDGSLYSMQKSVEFPARESVAFTAHFSERTEPQPIAPDPTEPTADPTPASPKPDDTKPSPKPDDTKPSETKPADTKPTPKPINNPFVDVASGDYFYDPVLWALTHEPQITDGMTETTFAPGETCTRGQVVTFLWRAMGCAEPKTTNNPFSDVSADDYFFKPVLWAVEMGITDGTSDTTFSPGDPCTRAHVVTFLHRAEGKPAAGSKNPFTDVAKGEYYTDAVLWAVSKGITDGTSDTTFSPADPCTRGQIVTFLYRDMK